MQQHEEEILAQEGPILLVKNKYPTLEDTFQTVVIETDDCDSELSTYSREHLHKLIRFGVEKWLEMEASGEFTSVIFYKNHGPLSGGSIHHPHMQIVGLKHIDYRQHVRAEHFEGLVIDRRNGVEFNISTAPRMGFFEFNARLPEMGQLNQMADYIQIAARYVLNHFNKNCNSYNLFFYQIEGRIFAKIVPRFAASPLFVGYSIPQVSDRLEEVARDIQGKYLPASQLTR
ncbi:DUF4931 domain-containing protein [Effusibacillus consociatus]|uniref:DUF4931 domain-containing protein n=1 Tax=Effusibacillus consociatus TaxID=1117041 RepID=A0ABV9Q2E5_9BACL